MILSTTSFLDSQLKSISRSKSTKQVTLNNVLYDFSPKEYTYYSVDSVIDIIRPENENGDLIKVKFILDTESQVIERKVYTIYDMLGQVGGFMGVVLPFSAF